MHSSKFTLQFLIVSIFLQLFTLAQRAGKSRPGKRAPNPKSRDSIKRPNYAETAEARPLLVILFTTVSIVVAPHIIYFIYTICRDPEAPALLQQSVSIMIQRGMGYLSNNGRKSNTDDDDDKLD